MKEYLGDGVYVYDEADNDYIVLTTEDGIRVTNKIYLDEVTITAFLTWLKKRDAATKRE